MPQIGRRIYPGMRRAAWGFMQSGDFPVPVLHLKFGENTGDVAYDSSPEGNDGDIEGASWVKGYLGPGLEFDRLDDYVLIPHSESLDITDEITIAIRVKGDMDYGVWQDFLGKTTSEAERCFELRPVKNSGAIQMLWGAVAPVTTTDRLTDDTWYDVVAVGKAESYAAIYIDGILSKSSSTAETIPSHECSLGIGRLGDMSTQYFKGTIDEVRIYDVDLTAAQIRQLSQGYR